MSIYGEKGWTLPSERILFSTKLKAFVDNKIEIVKQMIFVLLKIV